MDDKKMSIKSLENSLNWQKVVLSQSKDQKQIQRAKEAIKKIEDQIQSMTSKG
jgi:hypothetical protein